MRKKSHLALSRYLLHKIDLMGNVTNKKSFYFGSILPDCLPSFISKRHTMEETFSIVCAELRYLIDEWTMTQNGLDGEFLRKLGVVTHYLADYFTFPHNPIFHGTISEHCSYESILKDKLNEYLRILTPEMMKVDEAKFLSADDMIAYIKKKHSEYELTYKNIQMDVTYIVQICYQVVYGILVLVEERLEQKHLSYVEV